MPDPEALRAARQHRHGPFDWRAEVFIVGLGFIGGALGFAVWELLFLENATATIHEARGAAQSLQQTAVEFKEEAAFFRQVVDAFCTEVNASWEVLVRDTLSPEEAERLDIRQRLRALEQTQQP